MCLEIVAIVDPDTEGRISADWLSQITGLVVSTRRVEGKPTFHFSVSGCCSCEFLSDEAKSDGDTWLLLSAYLPALSQAVMALSRECRKFAFVAHWTGGEQPRKTQKTSGAALARRIAENRIGNNILYLAG